MSRTDSVTTYPEGLVDIDGAAAWLGVPRSWVRDKATAREIPITWIGKHIRFSADNLRDIVAAGQEQPVTVSRRGPLRAVG